MLRVHVSEERESSLRALLLNTPAPPLQGRAAPRNLRRRLLDLYESTTAEGFAEADVQAALRAAISVGDVSSAAVFDWLCLHAYDRLPPKFSAGERFATRGGEVLVLAVARADAAESRRPEEPAGLQLPPPLPNTAVNDAVEAREREKEWIRRYVQEASSDESDDASVPEDWDAPTLRQSGRERVQPSVIPLALMGAPDSPEWRLALATELYAARCSAKAAKAARDNDAQQRAGAVIRAVKDQLARAGLNDSVLSPALRQFEAQSLATTPDPPAVAGSDAFDLFDEIAAAAAPAPVKVAALPTILSRATRALPGRPALKKPEPPDTRQQPKSMLQQHCARQQWPPPRFERCPAGPGIFSYSLIISVTLPAKRGKQQVQRVVVEPPETAAELARSVEVAQNAVAARALYQLLPDQPLHRSLLPPYSDLWRSWEAAASSDARDETAEREAAVHRFVDELLSSSSWASSVSSDTGNPGMGTTLTGVPGHAVLARVQSPMDVASLRAKLEEREQCPRYAPIGAQRAALPIAGVRSTIAAALASSDMMVVCGETGCGKTTQVPQFLLDDATLAGQDCNLICTQPRRVAAMSVAERVAFERLEAAPGAPGALVGYQVRLEAARTAATRLLFCTAGILLRRLHGDPLLSGTTHVVLDEVHERSLQTDLLLTILRDLPARRTAAGAPPVKLILMSATLDASFFSGFLQGAPVISAEGRTFPVTRHHLEDVYEMCNYLLPPDSPAALRHQRSGRKIAAVAEADRKMVADGWGDEQDSAPALNTSYDPTLYESYGQRARLSLSRVNEGVIDYELLDELLTLLHETQPAGAVLVFLPGIREVGTLVGRLSAARAFRGAAAVILPLHSALPAAEQRRVFQTPPRGCRKVVVATNIAETSLTIPDVVYVIDAGRQKCRQYDSRRSMSSLKEEWVSAANARQRQGRAGRVQPGQYYALYTAQRAAALRPYPVPEMLRVALTETALQIKSLDLGAVEAVLARAPDPPAPAAVAEAVGTLEAAGALDATGALTPLGRHLARLPVDVRAGKIIVMGAVLGCLRPALTIAAYLSSKSPFLAPHDEHDAADRVRHAFASPSACGIAAGQRSDHLLVVAAYDAWRAATAAGGSRAGADYCRRHWLDSVTLVALHDMRSQFAELLLDAGFLGRSERGCDALEVADDSARPWNATAAYAAVLRDGVLCAGLYPQVAVGTDTAGRIAWAVGGEKVAVHPSSVNAGVAASFLKTTPFLLYHEKLQTSQVYIRECSAVSPVGLLLFGGDLAVQHAQGTATVGADIKLRIDAQTAVLFKTLRTALDAELQQRVASPDTPADAAMLTAIVRLLRSL